MTMQPPEEEFLGYTQKLIERVNDPDFKRIENKVSLVQDLKRSRNFLPEPQFSKCLEITKSALQLTEDRLLKIMTLEQKEAVRRALKVKSTLKERPPEDEVFPTDGFFGAYLDWIGIDECPGAFHFWASVVALATCVRRNFTIDRGNHYLFPNLYLMISGPAATRKSQAIDTAKGMVFKAQWHCEKRGVEDWQQPRILADATTPEKFVHDLKTEKIYIPDVTGQICHHTWKPAIGTVFSSEASTFMGKQNFNVNKLLTLMTDMYNCGDPVKSTTLTRGDDVLRYPCVSFVGGSTVDWMRDNMPSTLFGGGFISRMLFIYRNTPDYDCSKASYLDPVMELELAQWLAKWADHPQTETTAEDGFDEWFDEWYKRKRDIQKNVGESRLESYFNRKEIQLLKLSMFLALAQDRTHVYISDAVKADSILAQEEKNLPNLFRQMDAHPSALNADYIYEYLYKRGGKMGHSELMRGIAHRVGTRQHARDAVEYLEEQKRIRRIRRRGGVVWEVVRSRIHQTMRVDDVFEEE